MNYDDEDTGGGGSPHTYFNMYSSLCSVPSPAPHASSFPTHPRAFSSPHLRLFTVPPPKPSVTPKSLPNPS
jgi:hypothetical protein